MEIALTAKDVGYLVNRATQATRAAVDHRKMVEIERKLANRLRELVPALQETDDA